MFSNLGLLFGNLGNGCVSCKCSVTLVTVCVVSQRLLTDAGSDATVFLTSGYFNLTRAYMRLVLGAGADYRILTASPEVNGFFGAKGVAGAIPAAYIHIARQFYSKVCKLHQQDRVHLHEYHRLHWTFHAKGGLAHAHTCMCV